MKTNYLHHKTIAFLCILNFTFMFAKGLTLPDIDLNSVFFVNANTGYIAGDDGYILKTTNAGQTWISQIADQNKNAMLSVFFTDTINGYATSDGISEGGFYKTTNGGNSWDHINSTNAILYSIYFINTDTGYAAGTNGTILKTINGGLIWDSLPSNSTKTLSSVFFTDANTGYAAGNNGTILKTVNGGSTWEAQTSGTTDKLNSIYFIDANTGYIVGNYGTILKTSNGGSTWSPLTSGNGSDFFSVFFTSSKTGFVVGGYFEGVLLKTDDEGDSWNMVGYHNNWLTSIYFSDANNGYAVGSSGALLRSTDAGNTWDSLIVETDTTPTPPVIVFVDTNWVLQPQVTYADLKSICFPNSNTGFIAGSEGTILKTINKGNTWVPQTTPTQNTLNSVYFIDATSGYAVGNEGTILKTVNAGGIWTEQPIDNPINLYSVYFINRDTGYAVGHSGSILAVYQNGFPVGVGGRILKTTDGGATWNSKAPSGASMLSSVYFTSTDTGYAVGSYGARFKTEDGGTTWINKSSGSSIHFYSIHFFDALNGYAVGYPGVIHRTKNGGNNWESENFLYSSRFNSVFCTDVNTAYSVNNWGSIYKTDEEISWKKQNSSNIDLFSICFSDANTGFAVGSSGTIIKYSRPSVQESKLELLSTFNIRAYPNPTDGLFEIVIDEPFTTYYKVEVYNDLGVLVKKIILNGSELTYQIDLTSFPTGIYLLNIKSENKLYQSKIIKR